MNTVPFQRFQLALQPLSPIHIGSGETIEPYEYDLEDRNGTGVLQAFDLDRVLAELSPRQRSEFDRVVARNDFPALRSWLRRAAHPQRHLRFQLVVNSGAFGEIRAHLDDPARLGEIHLFTRDPAAASPYLPGSSIKGAIRTAVVDALARENPQRQRELLHIASEAERPRRAGPKFEAAVLGNRKPKGSPDLFRDPFRQLAVSDIPMPQQATYIDRIEIVRPAGSPSAKNASSDPSGIRIYRELTRSAVLGEERDYTGEVRLYEQLTDRRRMQNENVLPRAFDIPSLCAMCNRFYLPRLREELARFGVHGTVQQRLLEPAEAMGENECLIRLGRHSHFECVTVGPPFCRPPRRGFGGSRSYADGLLPLGWARLKLTPLASGS